MRNLIDDNSPYNLRQKRPCKRKIIFTPTNVVERKRLRSYDHVTALPNEILLYVFSFLPVEDLYFNVRLVCRKWYKLAMLSPSWGSVTADDHISTQVLKNWIHTCPVIKKIRIVKRNDANVVLENVTKFCKYLRDISIEDCWGSKDKPFLNSDLLCRLLTRCKNVEKINFDKVKVRSCKFFKLLARRRCNGKFKQLSYVGPVTTKQYLTLRESCSGWIFTEFVDIDESD